MRLGNGEIGVMLGEWRLKTKISAFGRPSTFGHTSQYVFGIGHRQFLDIVVLILCIQFVCPVAIVRGDNGSGPRYEVKWRRRTLSHLNIALTRLYASSVMS